MQQRAPGASDPPRREPVDTELLDALGVDYPGLMEVEYTSGVTKEWISIPVDELEALVRKWVDHVETAPTDDVCLCEWLFHPDDAHLPKTKQRRKKAVEHPRCPVHTKLGYLLGFFVFTFPTEEGNADPS